MSRRTQQEDPLPDEQGARPDLPWRIVEAIEPDEDVLSKLIPEQELEREPSPPASRPPEHAPTPGWPLGLGSDAPTGPAFARPSPQAPQRPASRDRLATDVRPAGADRRRVTVLPTDTGRVLVPPRHVKSRRRGRFGVLVVAALLMAVSAMLAWPAGGIRWLSSLPLFENHGTLVVESRPGGLLVSVDGVTIGHTPVSTALTPGRHTLTLAGTVTREMEVVIDRGARVQHYVELPEVVQTGTLRIETAVPGAQVVVDGTPHGTTPVDIPNLEPGVHSVTVRWGSETVSQEVTVKAGDAISVVVPLTAAPPALPGWLTVDSPIELQVYDGLELVGTSRVARMLMLAGRHELRLVNLPLGYETTRTVQIASNRVTTVAVQPPNGIMHVNAIPWAEVFLDGTRIGETPIANFPASLGSHEIVLRHPRLGERRLIVTVSLTAPARVGVDMQK